MSEWPIYNEVNVPFNAILINHDLILLSQWAKQWLVTFNPSKTEAILFTLRNFDHMPFL